MDYFYFLFIVQLDFGMFVFILCGVGGMFVKFFVEVIEVLVGDVVFVGDVIVYVVYVVYDVIWWLWGGLCGDVVGYVVEGFGVIYFVGDILVFDGMGLFYAGKFDFALLFVWGWGLNFWGEYMDFG